MDTMIIPIKNEEIDATVTALTAWRQDYSLPVLAQMEAHQLRNLLREKYHEANDAKVITLINLIIKKLGVAQEGKIKFNVKANLLGLTVMAEYDTGSNTTLITVNDQIVCSNNQPGSELFLSGKWLTLLIDQWRIAESTQLWRSRIDDQAEREKLIQHIAADV